MLLKKIIYIQEGYTHKKNNLRRNISYATYSYPFSLR